MIKIWHKMVDIFCTCTYRVNLIFWFISPFPCFGPRLVAVVRQAIIFSCLHSIFLFLLSPGVLWNDPPRAIYHWPIVPYKIGRLGKCIFQIRVFYRLCILLRTFYRQPKYRYLGRACCYRTNILRMFFRHSKCIHRNQIFCFVPSFLCKDLCLPTYKLHNHVSFHSCKLQHT